MKQPQNAPSAPPLHRKADRVARRYMQHLGAFLDAEKGFQKSGLVLDPSFFRFAAFAMQHIRKSKSQFYQDLWALSEVGGKHGGFFVEFGAASGRKFSNTFMMEKLFGWSGILAEPNPGYHAALAQNRTAPVCTDLVHSTTGETRKFAVNARGMFSKMADDTTIIGQNGVTDILSLQTVSLNDLLRRYQAPERVDYMSIDVEGAELDILSGFDFDDRRVTCFTVEAGDPDDRQAILALMDKNGYALRWPELNLGELFLIDRSVL